MGITNECCECKNKDSSEKRLPIPIQADDEGGGCIRSKTAQTKIKTGRRNYSLGIDNNNKLTLESAIQNNAADIIIRNYRRYKSSIVNEDKITSNEDNINLRLNKNEISNNFSPRKNINDNKEFIENNNLKTKEEIMALNIYKEYSVTSEDKSKNSETSREHLHNIITSNEYIYIGNKINNLKEGFGVTIWNNNTKYVGFYKNDKANGWGKFMSGDSHYEGGFSEGGASGFGIYNHGKETFYMGYWRDDSQESYGIERWKDGAEYLGEYYEGKKHGIGTYIWDDGSKYQGEWRNNRLEGYGIYFYNGNSVYIGGFKNSLKEGFCEFICPEKKYIGFYSKDKKNGFGMFYWKNVGKAFIGFWKDGKQLGIGKYMTKNQKKYGIWKTGGEVIWIKNEEEAFYLLSNEGLKEYKFFFTLTLDDIGNYCINNDNFDQLLVSFDT